MPITYERARRWAAQEERQGVCSALDGPDAIHTARLMLGRPLDIELEAQWNAFRRN